MKRGAGRRGKRVYLPPSQEELKEFKEAWREALLKLLRSLEESEAPSYYIEAIREVIEEIEKIPVQTRLL
ncbi:MAG: hypothetical protein DRJ52_05690 [Thermoprotei archaeon]|nr:MAG: hypothetical protein DRJ52_05690 [Thermoprotei archaeon]